MDNQMVENIQPTVKETIAFIIALHGDQKDKSGAPYFSHPARVMIRLGPDATDSERMAALLHDVVEDTDTTLWGLRLLGFSEEVVEMVDLLTKREDETHRSYIFRIVSSGNKSVMKIKLADMYDNSNLTRLEGCADPVVRSLILDMIESRYKPAIRFMKDALGEAANEVIADDVEVQFEFGGDDET